MEITNEVRNGLETLGISLSNAASTGSTLCPILELIVSKAEVRSEEVGTLVVLDAVSHLIACQLALSNTEPGSESARCYMKALFDQSFGLRNGDLGLYEGALEELIMTVRGIRTPRRLLEPECKSIRRLISFFRLMIEVGKNERSRIRNY